MNLTIDNLKINFYSAISNNAKYIGMKIWMYGFEKPEIIINPTENFKKKLKYYEIAYNNDLTLKNAPNKIKIVGFTFGNDFKDIEKDLI